MFPRSPKETWKLHRIHEGTINEETLMRHGGMIAIGHLSGQSGKATRKRADVELKPPVGESAAESAGRPLSAHRVIAQFPPCRSLHRLGGCLGWKTQHSAGHGHVAAGRQASMTEPFPAADGTWAVRPPSTPLAEQRNQKNKIVRKNLSPFLPVGHGGPIPKRG